MRTPLLALLLSGCAMDFMSREPAQVASADAAPGELATDSSREPEPEPADAAPEEIVDPTDAPPQQLPDVGRAVLFPRGSVWRYLDDGSDQGDAWRRLGFDASAWVTGPSEFGYGDGDEATVVSFGGDPAAKHITTYFRRRVEIADPTVNTDYRLSVRADDGVVIYLNGTEVARVGMPAGDPTFATLAIADGPDEDAYTDFDIPVAAFRAGSNLWAVEVHQQGPASSDISFDAELTSAFP